MKAVSVIIPCRNGLPFLEQTLASVRRQTFTDYEVVLVDDGSTDGSAELARRLDPHIRILRHAGGANLGATASMNLAIARSSSRHLAFLDADDLWLPTKLEEQVALLESEPEVGLVYTDGDVIDAAGVPQYGLMPEGHAETNDPARLLMDCYIRTPSQVMLRRDVLGRVGRFNERYQYSKDHDMWLRVSETARLHFLPRRLTGYRQHPGQQSLRRNQWDEGFSVLANAAARYPYPLGARWRRKAVLYYRLGQHALGQGDRIEAAWRFAQALAHDPARAVSHSFASVLNPKG